MTGQRADMAANVPSFHEHLTASGITSSSTGENTSAVLSLPDLDLSAFANPDEVKRIHETQTKRFEEAQNRFWRRLEEQSSLDPIGAAQEYAHALARSKQFYEKVIERFVEKYRLLELLETAGDRRVSMPHLPAMRSSSMPVMADPEDEDEVIESDTSSENISASFEPKDYGLSSFTSSNTLSSTVTWGLTRSPKNTGASARKSPSTTGFRYPRSMNSLSFSSPPPPPPGVDIPQSLWKLRTDSSRGMLSSTLSNRMVSSGSIPQDPVSRSTVSRDTGSSAGTNTSAVLSSPVLDPAALADHNEVRRIKRAQTELFEDARKQLWHILEEQSLVDPVGAAQEYAHTLVQSKQFYEKEIVRLLDKERQLRDLGNVPKEPLDEQLVTPDQTERRNLYSSETKEGQGARKSPGTSSSSVAAATASSSASTQLYPRNQDTRQNMSSSATSATPSSSRSVIAHLEEEESESVTSGEPASVLETRDHGLNILTPLDTMSAMVYRDLTLLSPTTPSNMPARRGSATSSASQPKIPASITAISFSPDGNYFASGSKDGNIIVWNVNSKTPNGQPLAFHGTEITCLAFSPNSTTLVSSSYDSSFYMCDLKSKLREKICFEVGSPVTSVAYSPSGQYLVCGDQGCRVRVWNISMCSIPLRTYGGHSDAVTFVVYSPNEKLIASASDDLTIKIWGVFVDHKPVATIKLRKRVAAIRFTANNDHIVSASFSGSVRVWSVSTSQLISHQKLEGNRPFWCFAFSADGEYLASGSSDRAVRIHTTDTGKVIFGPYFCHESQIEAIAISPDSKLVVLGGHDASIRTWRIEISETKGSGDSFSALKYPLRDYNSAVGILDELWDHLRASASHESETRRSEMRDWSDYIIRDTYIDGGMCGDVYAGKWVNIPGLGTLAPPDVVLKIMRPNIRIAMDQGQSTNQDKKVRRELKVWMKLRHSNIVPFVGVAYGLEEGANSDSACPIMISLRMANGDLKRYLSQNEICDREAFPLQIARGLAYLHQFDPGIVHGDLKAKNVFVDGDGTLKLGDFGLSRMLSNESLWVTTAKAAPGTVRWMSPELLESQPTVTKESDIYAFAMTVFEIFSNQVPFAQYVNDAQVLTAVLLRKELPIRPHTIRVLIWDIMNDCWSFEPSQRLKIEEIIERLESEPQ